MTETRSRTGRRLATVALPALLVLAVLALTACESVMPPRALGAGEVVVVSYPSDSLTRGELALFAVRLNLPDDRYRIGLTVDPAGLDAEDGVSADDGALVDVTLSAQGGITVEQARAGAGGRPDGRLDGDGVTLAAGIVAAGEPATGVARGWRLTVDVHDPFTGALERILDEVFPYRVQWSE